MCIVINFLLLLEFIPCPVLEESRLSYKGNSSFDLIICTYSVSLFMFPPFNYFGEISCIMSLVYHFIKDIYIYIVVGDPSRGRPKGSLFNSYNTKVSGGRYSFPEIYIYKLVTLAEGDPKAPFSIATTARCSGGHYSIPRITPLYS